VVRVFGREVVGDAIEVKHLGAEGGGHQGREDHLEAHVAAEGVEEGTDAGRGEQDQDAGTGRCSYGKTIPMNEEREEEDTASDTEEATHQTEEEAGVGEGKGGDAEADGGQRDGEREREASEGARARGLGVGGAGAPLPPEEGADGKEECGEEALGDQDHEGARLAEETVPAEVKAARRRAPAVWVQDLDGYTAPIPVGRRVNLAHPPCPEQRLQTPLPLQRLSKS
jgi:hypothetical protein